MLIQCKVCKREVARSAKACPHCGASRPGVTGRSMAGGCLLMVVLFFLVVAVVATFDEGTVVTADEYGEEWPLTAREAKLYCNYRSERYMSVDGVIYALNGKALSAGMPNAAPVTKPGAYSGLLTERAGGLCRR